MDFKHEYKDGKITLDVVDLLRYLDADALREFAQSLACMDSVVSAVCEQLLTGYTEDAFAGDSALLDKYRAVLVSRSDEAVARDAEVLRTRTLAAERRAADLGRAMTYLWERCHALRADSSIPKHVLYSWLSTAGGIGCGNPAPVVMEADAF